MSELHRMNDSQFRRARKLIRRLCANYDGGNCLPLDDGDPCPCPQLISPTLIRKYFRAKGNRAVYCGPCAQKERRRKTRDRVRRHKG